ncbi:hypothetical protein R1sor_001918 [Riccia sorocarpa]|uniref:DDE-1 domain-containing protein n=1 Tax=Riccia sorocarpa TaxID=122646 RepID=A0ABD3GZA6_9MARC
MASSNLPSLFARQRVLNSRLLVIASRPHHEIPCIPEREPEQEASETPQSRSGKRAVQHVSTKQERQRVVKWMKAYAAEVGSEDSICSIAVKNFPTLFRQPNINANLQKASRWWKAREQIISGIESEVSLNCISHRHLGIRKKVMLKADSGRGRKREDWLKLIAVRRLRAAGLKFSPFVLKLVAQNVLQNSPHPICHTLGFSGDENVKYADVVSGVVSMTMVVKVTGGRSARISSPFMIFQNNQCSYPICGVPDNVPGVSYRSTKKSFMTTDCLVEYNERRANWADPGGATKVQWIDNVSSHNLTPEVQAALDNIRTQVRFLPENSTPLTQPCDSFVISKIKDAWTRMWEEYKLQMIVNGDWQGGGGPRTSGLLKNPGKTFFLKMAAAAVDEVNRQRTKEIGLPVDAYYEPPMTYARKAMILCGLSLNTNGQWDEKQLSTGLQTIISRYRSNFMGSREGLVTSFDSNARTLDPEQVNIPDSQCAHGSS